MLRIMGAFFLLLHACLSIAETVNEEYLNLQGRALANYQRCAQLGNAYHDNVMYSYYFDMFNDRFAEINGYSKNLSTIILNEFNRSAGKLGKIDEKSMVQLCFSRFDLLSRKMQEKKLGIQ